MDCFALAVVFPIAQLNKIRTTCWWKRDRRLMMRTIVWIFKSSLWVGLVLLAFAMQGQPHLPIKPCAGMADTVCKSFCMLTNILWLTNEKICDRSTQSGCTNNRSNNNPRQCPVKLQTFLKLIHGKCINFRRCVRTTFSQTFCLIVLSFAISRANLVNLIAVAWCIPIVMGVPNRASRIRAFHKWICSSWGVLIIANLAFTSLFTNLAKCQCNQQAEAKSFPSFNGHLVVTIR